MRGLALFTVLVLACLLRMLPAVYEGAPFSTDTWPIMAVADRIVKYSPHPLDQPPVSDGYNVYWPASALFSAVACVLTGLNPLRATPLLVPLASSTSALLLYVLAAKTAGRRVGLIAALLLSASGLSLLMTAAATKEAYALPLLLTVILLASGKRSAAALALACTALALSHHLTTLVGVAVLASYALVSLVRGLGLRACVDALCLSLVALTYHVLYAHRGLMVPVPLEEVVNVASFQAVTLAPLLAPRGPGPPAPRALWAVAPLIGVLVVVAGVWSSPCIGLGRLPSYVALMGLAYASLGLLAIIGYGRLGGRANALLPSWAASMAGLEAYAYFAAPPGLDATLSSRLLNFLTLPLFILAALGLTRTSFRRALTAATCLSIALSLPMLGALARLPFVGGQHTYVQSEAYALTLIPRLVGEGAVVAGDARVRYPVSSLSNVSVDVSLGYALLTGLTRPSRPVVLVVLDSYSQGYYMGPAPSPLPETWRGLLASSTLVYSTPHVGVVVLGESS